MTAHAWLRGKALLLPLGPSTSAVVLVLRFRGGCWDCLVLDEAAPTPAHFELGSVVQLSDWVLAQLAEAR